MFSFFYVRSYSSLRTNQPGMCINFSFCNFNELFLHVSNCCLLHVRSQAMFFYKIFCVICYIDSFLDLPQCNIIDILCFSSYVVSNYGPKRNKKKKNTFSVKCFHQTWFWLSSRSLWLQQLQQHCYRIRIMNVSPLNVWQSPGTAILTTPRSLWQFATCILNWTHFIMKGCGSQ